MKNGRVKKTYLLFFLLILSFETNFAQRKKKDFIIHPLNYKTSNSLYRTISLVDSRDDTSTLGFIQEGVFKIKTKVIPSIPIANQLNAVLDSVIDTTALNGHLLLDLRRLRFSEITSGAREDGYCHFHARIYALVDDRYHDIKIIDTVIHVSSKNVSDKLMEKTGRIIAEFIESAVLQEPDDSSFYNFSQVLKIDSIEKRKLPAYNTAIYMDGLYYSYKSFINQVPDSPVRLKFKHDNISSVKIPDANGKFIKVPNENIYAVVYENIPLICADDKYHALAKINDEFYFTGRLKVSKTTPVILALEALCGLWFARHLYVLSNSFDQNLSSIFIFSPKVSAFSVITTPFKKTYKVKLDYMNGKLMRFNY